MNDSSLVSTDDEDFNAALRRPRRSLKRRLTTARRLLCLNIRRRSLQKDVTRIELGDLFHKRASFNSPVVVRRR